MTIKDGAFFVIRNEARARFVGEELLSLDMSRAWECAIQEYSERRTDKQNRLYGLWSGLLAKHCGYTQKQMRALLASKFIGAKELQLGRDKIVIPMSSADLKVKEMTDFLDDVYLLGTADLGVDLPLPDHEGQYHA